MRKLFIGLVIFITLIGAAVLILPGLIPAAAYKDKIETQLSQSLGRKVEIAGDVKLSVFPVIQAEAEHVTIANAAGFSTVPLAKMDSLRAKVKLFPLLRRQVEITEFTLVSPQISLERSKSGEVNWAFGQAGQKPSVFRRDGRYTDIQLALGAFNLKNGQISYKDEQSGTHHELKSVNLHIDMPAMDKNFTAKGDVIVNDIPLDLSLTLKTPADFLNAKTAAFTLQLQSPLITLTTKGHFTPGQTISFEAEFESQIPSISKFDALFGIKNPYSALTETANFKGDISYDGVNLSAKNAQIFLASDLINTEFSGDFGTAPTPFATGALQMTIIDVPKTARLLQLDIPQAAALKTIVLSADLQSKGTLTEAENVKLTAKGDQLSAEYTGKASFDESLQLQGQFSAQSPSIPKLMDQMGLAEMQGMKALGDFSVSGQISGPTDALVITALDVNSKSEMLTARYQGGVVLGESISLNGQFNLLAPALKTLAQTSGIPIPYADALGEFTAQGQLQGPVTSLQFSALTAALKDGILNADFTGSASMGDGFRYQGNVNTHITSVRQLAALGGTQLPPSTQQGAIYEAFSLSGAANGDAKQIGFSNAKLSMDDLAASGEFKLMLQEKPFITGNLAMDGLDLRPYQAAVYAQRPDGIQPWSEEPLNLAFLNMIDGDFILTTPDILLDKITLGQSTVTSSLRGGILKTNIPSLTLYGGQGRLDMELNAQNPAAKFALDFTLEDMDGQGFLSAIAGYTKLTGRTGTVMKIRGQGRSQAEIMRSLDGNGNFELAEGVVSGIDMGLFVTGLEAAFASGALPAGIGGNHVTNFEKLTGLFTINQGVVSIGDFSLNAGTAQAEGSGSFDIGKQFVDFSLRPRIAGGTGLAGFGIPIRLRGNFGNINAGLDTDMLGKIIAARAKAEIQNQISGQVGGELGGLLGNILGGTPAPKQTEEEEPKKKEEDTLEKALGRFFGDD